MLWSMKNLGPVELSAASGGLTSKQKTCVEGPTSVMLQE